MTSEAADLFFHELSDEHWSWAVKPHVPSKGRVWRTAANGSNPLRMTSIDEGFSAPPRWSPDGKWIAVDPHTQTHGQINLIDSEVPAPGRSGTAKIPCLGGCAGTAVYFAFNRTGSWQVWRQNLATGRETQVTITVALQLSKLPFAPSLKGLQRSV